MIVFTLRTTNTPQCYDDSLAALRIVYPEIQVIDAGDKTEGKHAGWVTDRQRIAMLAEMWPGEAALYLDMDAVGHERINPYDYQKPSFPNQVGGRLDYWAIFRPAGQEAFFKKLLAEGKWDIWAWVQFAINNEYRKDVGIIYGYPTWKYLSHLQLSHQRS
jgi:hypothetical protein